MQSHQNGLWEYKSSLELKAIKFCDYNQHIVKCSLEPFAIPYVKPTTGKVHRYYIDLFIEFADGKKFLVEVKSSGETRKPRKPRKQTPKSMNNYMKALQTYATNQAKWAAAEQFAKEKGLTFMILTERELF